MLAAMAETLLQSAAAGAVGLLGASAVLAYAVRGAAEKLAAALALSAKPGVPPPPAPPTLSAGTLPEERRVETLPPLERGESIDLDGGLP